MRVAICVVALALLIGSTCAYIHSRRIQQHQLSKQRLENELQKDSRFSRVRVSVTTKPSAFVLAPPDLSDTAKSDLRRLTAEAFGSLPATVNFKSWLNSETNTILNH